MQRRVRVLQARGVGHRPRFCPHLPGRDRGRRARAFHVSGEHYGRLALYLVMAFGITWVCWWPLAFLIPGGVGVFTNPTFSSLYIVGGLGPTLAALLAVALTPREGSLTAYGTSLTRWRVPIEWYLVAFLLQPMLERRFRRLASAAIVGIAWALWHVPLFFIHGVAQYGANFPLFAADVVGNAFLLAWIYGGTGSILVCVLFHAASNTSATMGLGAWDGSPHMAWMGRA